MARRPQAEAWPDRALAVSWVLLPLAALQAVVQPVRHQLLVVAEVAVAVVMAPPVAMVLALSVVAPGAAHSVGLVEDDEVVEAGLPQLVAHAQATGAGADDHHPARPWRRPVPTVCHPEHGTVDAMKASQ